MSTQLKLVAVGYYNVVEETIVCDPTWQNSMDALPADHPTLFALEDAYHMGITDRDLGLPSRPQDYADAEERAAYLAGKCAARRVLSAAEILAELEDLHEAMDDENYWRIGAW